MDILLEPVVNTPSDDQIRSAQASLRFSESMSSACALHSTPKDGLQDAVENITRMMIKLHNHSARGFNSGYDRMYHHVVDANGEAPTTWNITASNKYEGLDFWSSCLQHYNVGVELIEPGDTPTLKPGSINEARKILGSDSNGGERISRLITSGTIVPDLCDPSLSMELAQHLFDVQMSRPCMPPKIKSSTDGLSISARHRDKYNVHLFPSNNTYAPPNLPSHINVTLQPINGTPSDDEVKSVQVALRASENLASFCTEGRHAARDVLLSAEPTQGGPAESVSAPAEVFSGLEQAAVSEANRTGQLDSGAKRVSKWDRLIWGEKKPAGLLDGTSGVFESPKVLGNQLNEPRADVQDTLKGALKDALKERLETFTQTMIKLHSHTARGYNSGGGYAYYHIVNKNGEVPTDCEVPREQDTGGYRYWGNASVNTLARYLQFYNIGIDLLEDVLCSYDEAGQIQALHWKQTDELGHVPLANESGGCAISIGCHPTIAPITTRMVQVNSPRANAMSAIYTPPELPTYLAGAFDLKAIAGIPTDEEVKLIHSVIRAVENTSHAHHLFEVQMARYKSKYSFPMISDITYTPPELPSHVNITLEPIINAPSDDQIRLAQAALRFSESMASVPSIYDADLSMKLSQHLFDLQLARYIHYRTEGDRTACGTSANVKPNEAPSTKRPRVLIESVLDAEPAFISESNHGQSATKSKSEVRPDAQTAPIESPDLPSATNALSTGVADLVGQLKANQDWLKYGLKDGLKDVLEVTVEKIMQMMIKLHNHSAQGFNSGLDYMYHHIVNENGEAPTDYHVPDIRNTVGHYFWSKTPDDILVRYLQYYNIGTDLIEQGDPPTLKPNSTEQARYILGGYTYTRT
ncbi:hypothetical protein BDV93DRAFT_512903 [Ceratobasidium sp. AG-I]|nr:hypothetical protein BDV93DRAFT_512903 [Ceratobasidium sp. AG-I]